MTWKTSAMAIVKQLAATLVEKLLKRTKAS